MLWTIFVVLFVLWLLGVATSYTLGGFIHILLILAIATVLSASFRDERPFSHSGGSTLKMFCPRCL